MFTKNKIDLGLRFLMHEDYLHSLKYTTEHYLQPEATQS